MVGSIAASILAFAALVYAVGIISDSNDDRAAALVMLITAVIFYLIGA